jgi:hypothetical protein
MIMIFHGKHKSVRFMAGMAAICVVAAVFSGLSGCATVKSYERGDLGDPIMERMEHFTKQNLEQKFFSSREGSIGGAGGIGGGCGCAK